MEFRRNDNSYALDVSPLALTSSLYLISSSEIRLKDVSVTGHEDLAWHYPLGQRIGQREISSLEIRHSMKYKTHIQIISNTKVSAKYIYSVYCINLPNINIRRTKYEMPWPRKTIRRPSVKSVIHHGAIVFLSAPLYFQLSPYSRL